MTDDNPPCPVCQLGEPMDYRCNWRGEFRWWECQGCDGVWTEATIREYSRTEAALEQAVMERQALRA